ncbi:MAG: hypothetical protein KBB39_07295 [Phycicoccus sp.]|nr:hypothetical protein [Phycicoccus sp.]
MVQNPRKPACDLPASLKTRTVEELLARDEVGAQREPMPPLGGAYDAGRVGPRRQ